MIDAKILKAVSAELAKEGDHKIHSIITPCSERLLVIYENKRHKVLRSAIFTVGGKDPSRKNANFEVFKTTDMIIK